jgi:hypothetical protein
MRRTRPFHPDTEAWNTRSPKDKEDDGVRERFQEGVVSVHTVQY